MGRFLKLLWPAWLTFNRKPEALWSLNFGEITSPVHPAINSFSPSEQAAIAHALPGATPFMSMTRLGKTRYVFLTRRDKFSPRDLEN